MCVHTATRLSTAGNRFISQIKACIPTTNPAFKETVLLDIPQKWLTLSRRRLFTGHGAWRPTTQQSGARQWCERMQDWAKRVRNRARLRVGLLKPAVLSICLANIRSLVNKLENMNVRIVAIKETWLHSSIPDLHEGVTGHTQYHVDHTWRGKKVCLFDVISRPCYGMTNTLD